MSGEIIGNWFQVFVLNFIPLLIVINPVGKIPIVISLSEGLSRLEQRKMIHLATVTAAIIGLFFLFLGQFVLKILGISVGSFTIAGGIVLLVLSIKYMTTGKMVEFIKEDMVAIVPIGTPLTVGPATITTLLLLATQFSLYMVLLAFTLNIIITWVIFLLSSRIVVFIGHGGANAFSRVFSLLLSAIAVNMIIRGLSLIGVLDITA